MPSGTRSSEMRSSDAQKASNRGRPFSAASARRSPGPLRRGRSAGLPRRPRRPTRFPGPRSTASGCRRPSRLREKDDPAASVNPRGPSVLLRQLVAAPRSGPGGRRRWRPSRRGPRRRWIPLRGWRFGLHREPRAGAKPSVRVASAARQPSSTGTAYLRRGARISAFIDVMAIRKSILVSQYAKDYFVHTPNNLSNSTQTRPPDPTTQFQPPRR